MNPSKTYEDVQYQELNEESDNSNNQDNSPSRRWIAWAFVVSFLGIYLIVVSIWIYESRQSDSNADSADNELTYSIESTTNKFNSQLNLLERLINRINSTFPSTHQLNNSETFKLGESESNLALLYSKRWNDLTLEGDQMKSNVNYCTQVNLTDPLRVKQNNLYWQVLSVNEPESDNIQMYLYNAYYDNRVSDAPVVVLIAANDKDKLSRKRKWWCLLWFESIKSPVLVAVSDYYTMMGDKPGLYHPELITCPIPSAHKDDIPQAVSLQTQGDCDKVENEPSNVLRVKYDQQTDQTNDHSIGVCVQAFRFSTYDVSVRLVEWLEMVKLMGADKVYFYVFGATDNMKKVLQYYQNEGLVDWRRLTLPGIQPNTESLYNLYAYELGEKFWPQELVELNDCLYRNIHRHKYLAVFDIDEMIVPNKVDNWPQLIKQVESKQSSYSLKEKAFYVNRHSHVCEVYQETEREGKSIPSYLYMSRHTYRSKEYSKWSNIKCFHRTDRVSAVHNHAPMRCVGDKYCNRIDIDPSDSVLWHYRRNQSQPGIKGRNTDCPIHDRRTWTFYETMENRVRSQLEKIFDDRES